MDEPDEPRTTVNVKGMPVRSWETAKKLAAKHGEPLGSLLGRAIDQMASQDSGPRELLPATVANLDAKTANPDADLVALLNAAAAVSAANPRGLKGVPGLVGLIADRVREARGLPPRPSPRPVRQLTGPVAE